MSAWKPSGRDPILVIGPDDRIRQSLSREIEALSTRVLHAATLGEAANLELEGERPPSVVVLPETEIAHREFEAQLAEISVRLGAPSLVPIAFGRVPDEIRRAELRSVGIELALFGRFGRHALRFQINRARSPWATSEPRGELRAPKEWRTRTYWSGKQKTVRCYSLSSGGAYFVTPRPWVVGSQVALELPVGRDRPLVVGQILYTNANAGDGVARSGLPRGMAVAFSPLSRRLRQEIRRDVSSSQRSLQV